MSIANGLTLEQVRQIAGGAEPAGPHVVSLLSMLGSGEEEERAWASDALQTIDATPGEIAEVVAAECKNSIPAVAAWACKLVAKLGAQATSYQSCIIECLNGHAELSVRQQAAWALAQIPELNSAAIAALERAATSADPRLKRLAMSALQKAAA